MKRVGSFAIALCVVFSPLVAAAGFVPFGDRDPTQGFTKGLYFSKVALCQFEADFQLIPDRDYFAKQAIEVPVFENYDLCTSKCFVDAKTRSSQIQQDKAFAQAQYDIRLQEAANAVDYLKRTADRLRSKLGATMQGKSALEARMHSDGYVFISEDEQRLEKLSASIVLLTKQVALADQNVSEAKVSLSKIEKQLTVVLDPFTLKGSRYVQSNAALEQCKQTCGKEYAIKKLACQKQFIQLRKEKCVNDYADGARYCDATYRCSEHPDDQQACSAEYLKCNRYYQERRSACNKAPSDYRVYQKTAHQFYYHYDVTTVDPDITGQWMDFEQGMIDQYLRYQTTADAGRKKVDQEIQKKIKILQDAAKTKQELAAQKEFAEKVAAEKARQKQLEDDAALEKALEQKRKDARKKENGALVKTVEDAMRNKLAKKLVKNADPNAKPIIPDAAKARLILDQAKKDGVVTPDKPTSPKEGFDMPVGQRVFDWAFNGAMDILGFVPKIGSAAEAAKQAYNAGKTGYGELTSDETNQKIDRAKKTIGRLGLLEGVPLVGTLGGYNTDAILDKAQKAGADIQSQWQEVEGAALDRPGSPGQTFVRRWTKEQQPTQITFEVKDAQGLPSQVSFSTALDWRQVGQDGAGAIYLYPTDENGKPSSSYYLRIHEADHTVELLQRQALLDSNGKPYTEVWKAGEWNY